MGGVMQGQSASHDEGSRCDGGVSKNMLQVMGGVDDWMLPLDHGVFEWRFRTGRRKKVDFTFGLYERERKMKQTGQSD
jgi:RNase P/RNase MRP subunit p29